MSDNTQEKNIFIFDAAEGMVLSQDIMTSTGHLIAAKDTVLTLDMIAKISEYNVLKINVYEEAAAQPEQPEVLEQMTYYEKIKQSHKKLQIEELSCKSIHVFFSYYVIFSYSIRI